MWVVILITNWQGKKEGEDVLMFVGDCTKFVGNFSGIIEKSTPHLYLSALPFAPLKSMMPGQLLDRFPGIAKVVVGQHYDWPRSQQVLQAHKAEVTKVASPLDGGHAVSGPNDRTIQLWDVVTPVTTNRIQDQSFCPHAWFHHLASTTGRRVHSRVTTT